MKKSFTILAVALCSTLTMAQTNQYFWYNGNFIMGNPINQIDSITFGQLENIDSITLYLPHTIKVVHDTIIQKEYVHDTLYINNCEENDSVIYIQIPPENEIWYTSISGDIIPLTSYSGTLLSNTYENGKGIYKFSNKVTSIVYNQFLDTSYTSISLPETITSIASYGFSKVGPKFTNKNLEKIILSANLSSIGVDAFGGTGANNTCKVHICFLSKNPPTCSSRTFWNLWRTGYVFHYPKNSSYDSLITRFIDDFRNDGKKVTEIEPHTYQVEISDLGTIIYKWIPTEYIVIK